MKVLRNFCNTNFIKKFSEIIENTFGNLAGTLKKLKYFYLNLHSFFISFSRHLHSIFTPFGLHFGSILGSFWVHFASLGGPERGSRKRPHFSSILGSPWAPSGLHFSPKIDYFFNQKMHHFFNRFLMRFWLHFGSILGSILHQKTCLE